jgi:hypothetical protein
MGATDEVVVKTPRRSAGPALRWSDDGQHLAVGTQSGEAAIVTFPPQVFK